MVEGLREREGKMEKEKHTRERHRKRNVNKE